MKSCLKSTSLVFKHATKDVTHHTECQNGSNLTVVLPGLKNKK